MMASINGYTATNMYMDIYKWKPSMMAPIKPEYVLCAGSSDYINK